MSKIDEFNKAENTARKIADAVDCTLGTDRPNNDKHRFYADFDGLANKQWAPMKISIHAIYGYYGSSSGYSASSAELGKYLARAITEKKEELLRMASTYARKDAEEARLSAMEEAKRVISAAG